MNLRPTRMNNGLVLHKAPQLTHRLAVPEAAVPARLLAKESVADWPFPLPNRISRALVPSRLRREGRTAIIGRVIWPVHRQALSMLHPLTEIRAHSDCC